MQIINRDSLYEILTHLTNPKDIKHAVYVNKQWRYIILSMPLQLSIRNYFEKRAMNFECNASILWKRHEPVLTEIAQTLLEAWTLRSGSDVQGFEAAGKALKYYVMAGKQQKAHALASKIFHHKAFYTATSPLLRDYVTELFEEKKAQEVAFYQKKMSILHEINNQRKKDVEEAKKKTSIESLLKQLETPQFPLINFPERLQFSQKLAIMAEIKRASPSKGDIALHIDAASQGLLYARAGAAAISVLTEPKWFKTTLEDMRAVRMAVDGLPNRPAILRKEFIVDEYQIYEARVYGADTLLLIVASLDDSQLHSFLDTARRLNMEPLVEVANATEMKRAINAGAKVIGINNRDLHTFNVDLKTTSNLISATDNRSHVIFAALSGISSRKDVVQFEEAGARAVLVGEALMLAPDPAIKIRELLGEVQEAVVPAVTSPPRRGVLVKICGIMDVPQAIAAANAGADFIGLVFAQSRRQVSVAVAKEIAAAIRNWRKREDVGLETSVVPRVEGTEAWFTAAAERVANVVNIVRPLVVGVFANNEVGLINSIAKEVPLDIVQLSGKEGWAVGEEINTPAWRCVHVGTENSGKIISGLQPGRFLNVVLDTSHPSALGGTGQVFDWRIAAEIQNSVPVILAGGLTPDNVNTAVTTVKPFAVDVSSGVETEGVKDINKIQQFIINAKKI